MYCFLMIKWIFIHIFCVEILILSFLPCRDGSRKLPFLKPFLWYPRLRKRLRYQPPHQRLSAFWLSSVTIISTSSKAITGSVTFIILEAFWGVAKRRNVFISCVNIFQKPTKNLEFFCFGLYILTVILFVYHLPKDRFSLEWASHH